MDDHVQRLVAAAITEDAELAEVLAGDSQWLLHATDEEVQTLLRGVAEQLDSGCSVNERQLASLLRQLVERAYSGGDRSWKRLTPASRASLVRLYTRLGRSSKTRHSLLQLLAASQSAEDLGAFAELVVEDPPAGTTAAAMSWGPLFQHRDYDPSPLFPRLLDALANASLAPLVMDLANYVTREGMLPAHPAAERQDQLAGLLGAVVQRLGVIEERPDTFAENAQDLAAIVGQSVSLAVALCDALGLIGEPAAIGKLNQVLELRHRRLRTEAAAALARLGDENGRDVLLSLAAEPVARLRVLAYAEELEMDDRLDERFTTPAARAESELACWLSEPTQLGFPPSHLELVDSQTMYWPGYDEPVECFLFRFSYEMGDRQYANIGIAGPLCHAVGADLADLPPTDIYALFAGWHAEHDEIYEFDAMHLSESQRVDLSRLERRLRDEGCEAIRPVTFGMFFGEKVLVAHAQREGQPGIAVTSHETFLWLATSTNRRPLGPQEAYCLFKGRQLLRAFNE